MTCALFDVRCHRGFSLLECLLACTLLTVGVLALAALIAASSSLGAKAQQITVAAISATQKLEELSSGILTGDEEATDFTGRFGEPLQSAGGVAPPGTALVRRWSVRQRGGGAQRTFVLTVTVESRRGGPIGAPDVRLVTTRLRPAP